MSVPKPALVSWAFAVIWLIGGLKAYGKYPSGMGLALCLIGTGQLGWLGYLFYAGQKGLVLLALLGFAITWILTLLQRKRQR